MENNQIIFYSNRPFHSKYRPQKFDQIVGQEHIICYLKKTFINKRVSFAYLLIGKHGVGKTTLSRLVAKSLNCFDNYINKTFEPCNICLSCRNINLGKSFDVHEINGAMSNGIENVRGGSYINNEIQPDVYKFLENELLLDSFEIDEDSDIFSQIYFF
jgi:DNA polymerase III gamma/tau subunit